MAKNNFSNPFEALQKLKNELPVGEKLAPPTAPTSSMPATSAQPTTPSLQLQDKRSITLDEAPIALTRHSRSYYDSLLCDEVEDSHHPNPFDFVSFSVPAPRLYSQSVIEDGQKLFSGYMNVKITALTPVHVTGKQVPEVPGRKIAKSNFYKEDNSYCIPGSSIKGMLRGFMEALTNGWVSQAQEEADDLPAYPKVYGITDPSHARHLGFDSYKVTENTHGSGRRSKIQPAIPKSYRFGEGEGVDIPSYLFGSIRDNKEGARWKIRFEDALFANVVAKPMIDIENSAFMGGAHPSVSSWWYMMPSRICKRSGTLPNGRPYETIEMVGEGAWGRKFYFHQDPEKCINFYTNENLWPSDPRRPLYKFNIDCFEKASSASFRIDFERIPESLLKLLCLCLMPGDNIRHKIGYGKQYGYGSVDFSITDIKFRDVSVPFDVMNPERLAFKDYELPNWSERNNLTIAGKKIMDDQALSEIARILGWEDVYCKDKNILCRYPLNRRPYFQTVLQPEEFAAKTAINTHPHVVSNDPANGLEIAKKLWSTKKAMHFLLYQAKAIGYHKIMGRTP